MKKLITVSLVASLAAALVTSCATSPTNAQNAQTAITAAAALGTAYDLQQRPADLPYFLAAEAELYTIGGSTNTVTAATIDAALQQAGQTNTLESIGLITAINIANTYISNSAIGSTNNVTIQDAATWLANGIAESAEPSLATVKSKATFKK